MKPRYTRCFIPYNTSRQLCVDSRKTVLDRQKVLLAAERAFTPITTSTHRRSPAPRRPLWMPSAQTYTQSRPQGCTSQICPCLVLWSL